MKILKYILIIRHIVYGISLGIIFNYLSSIFGLNSNFEEYLIYLSLFITITMPIVFYLDNNYLVKKLNK